MKNRTPTPHAGAPADRRSSPDFTPVPRRCKRHDGWTPARQRAFIEALAETGSVSSAAARVNMAAEGVYALRRQPGAESFCEAWEAALDHGVRSLADLAIDRARHGVAVPIFHKGEQVGEKRWYNDRLLMFVLRHHLPDRYGLQLGGGTRSKATIEREAAQNCPTCRATREQEAEANSDAAKNAWLDDILRRYFIKVRQEQEERRAGRWYAADFYLRQLTHIELILATGGRSQAMLDAYTRNPERYGGELHAHDISHALAERRALWWAHTDGLPRPPQSLTATMTHSEMTQPPPNASASGSPARSASPPRRRNGRRRGRRRAGRNGVRRRGGDGVGEAGLAPSRYRCRSAVERRRAIGLRSTVDYQPSPSDELIAGDSAEGIADTILRRTKRCIRPPQPF